MITVLDADGDMSYSRSVAHLSVGQTVKFTLGVATTAFKLTFIPSPFVEGQLFESGVDNSATGTIKTGTPVGQYYYSVSALYSGTNQWYKDPGCPEIVVK